MALLKTPLLCLTLLIESCNAVLFAEEVNNRAPLQMYSAVTPNNTNLELIEKTYKKISEAISPRKIVYKNTSIYEQNNAADKGEADIIVAGANFAIRRNLSTTMRDLGTALTIESPYPDAAVGTTVIALKSRTDINSLEDLSGKSIASNDPEGFQGILILRYELFKLGLDPFNSFSKEYYFGTDLDNALKLLRTKSTDVVALPSCTIERMLKSGVNVDDIKIVGEKKQSYIHCKLSTDYYPNWSLMLSNKIDMETRHKIIVAVHSMRLNTDGIEWGAATETTKINDMYRALRMGPYIYLREWSFREVWREYREWFLVAIAVLGCLLLHSLRVSQLVKKRTRELDESLRSYRKLHERVVLLKGQNEKVRRMAVVSQFSSLVAHELNQPLGNILLYSDGIKQILQKNDSRTSEALRIIEQVSTKIYWQAARAREIVDRVRNFAKNRTNTEFTLLLLPDLIRNAVSDWIAEDNITDDIVDILIDDETAGVLGNALDLRVAITNILRNSNQAMVNTPDKHIWIHLCSEEDNYWHIVFTDNGPRLREGKIKEMNIPLATDKPNGLGLGLSLTRGILESHFSKLTLKISSKGNLQVEFLLPKAQSALRNIDHSQST